MTVGSIASFSKSEKKKGDKTKYNQNNVSALKKIQNSKKIHYI